MATRRTEEFLDGNHARYDVITHSPAYTAQEVAASVHLPGKYMAKTVIVKIDGSLAMAVVPATANVDLSLLGREVGAGDVRLAEEAEFADRFTGCQLGAAPPFGHLFGVETYVDRDMAKRKHIVFNAGTHSDAISMRFADYRRLAHPLVVRIASNSSSSRPQFAQL